MRHSPSAPAPGVPLREYWEAETCGTHYVDAEKFSKAYFDSIAAHRYRVEPFVRDFADFDRWRGKRGLEVGVGAGTDFVEFLRAGAEMSGVDLTKAAVQHVEQRAAAYGLPSPNVLQANAEQLPFTNDAFDFVYSFGVIHHADNTWKVFDEIYRVTKPGGAIKIMVYNLDSTQVWLKWLHHAWAERKWRIGPGRGRRWALANFQESGGTKGYTQRDIERELARYAHSDLRFSYDADRVQPGEPHELLSRVFRAIEPARMRWCLMFELTKRAVQT
ncbi:MAG: class I SAM-dependent methyltransferase [Gemmatimonadaceae bacterium]